VSSRFTIQSCASTSKQWAIELGDPVLPAQVGVRHHALADARWTQEAWRHLAQLDPSGGDRRAIGSLEFRLTPDSQGAR
jgi:hypothetical protein